MRSYIYIYILTLVQVVKQGYIARAYCLTRLATAEHISNDALNSD